MTTYITECYRWQPFLLLNPVFFRLQVVVVVVAVVVANQNESCMFPSNVSARIKDIFARFMTMREKQLLARAMEIHKENWG